MTSPINKHARLRGEHLVGADRLTVLEICLCLTVVACSAMTFIFWQQSQMLSIGLTIASVVAAATIVTLRAGHLPFMAAAIILIVDVFCVIHLLSLLAAPSGIGSYYYYCTMLGAFFFLGAKGGLVYTGACLIAVFALYSGAAVESDEAMTEFLVLLISIFCTAVIAFFYEQAVLKRTYVLADALESVTQLAQVDYLTDIFNRRQFTVNAIKQFEKFGPKTLIAIKIDEFKTLKDTHGYGAGDQVLRDIGQVVASQFKGTALFGRTGEDQFMVMLPATEMTAKARAEELKRAIAGLQYRFGDTEVKIAISFSVTSRGRSDDSFPALMARSKAALAEPGELRQSSIAAATRKISAIFGD